MKFVCNNCGFSAEVPDRRSNCPMCASSNVSVAALTENPSIQAKPVNDQPEKEDSPEETVKPVVETKTGVENTTETPRKEKITLSDDFFDSKPNKEEQEIANILKELYPETGETKAKMTLPGIKAISIGSAVVIMLIIGAFFAFSAGPEKKETAVEEEKDTEENSIEKAEETAKVEEPVEEKVEEVKVVEKVEEKIEERPVEKVKEEVVEIKKEEVVVKKAESVKPVEQKKPEVKKPEVVKQVKRTPETPKKVQVKQTTPKVDNASAFNSFVQAGHKALADKSYTDALHEYKNASRLNPSNGPIYKFLGIAYAYLQNQEQACVNYRKYIQLSPNAPDKAQVEAFIKACP